MGVEGLCVLVAHSGGPLEYDRPMSLLFCAENGHEMEAGCDAAWANHDHLWLWIRCWRTDVPVTLAGVTGAEAH